MAVRRLATGPLHCPLCGESRPPHERFCHRCGLPLVAGEAGASRPADGAADGSARRAGGAAAERARRARQIKPQLTEGRLVIVARVASGPEAQMVSERLLAAGVPSLVRRAAGFDVPELLAAGPREVLVPESGAPTAREVLARSDLDAPQRNASPHGSAGEVARRAVVAPLPLALALAGALALGTLVIWAITLLR